MHLKMLISKRSVVLVLVVLLGSLIDLAFSAHSHGNVIKKKGVSYDSRSLIINGRRELLFSGSVHYPRSPPEMWPDILSKAKHGGINVIQTYVFWNIHEPVQGQYNFEGNYDLVRFIKMIGEQGMHATLRVGPYIEAEWNYGGFPHWLAEVPNITFRTDNPPFKYHMKRFTKMIVQKMKHAKLFASQGGPIILSQIENEYGNVQLAFKEHGTRYIQWAGEMAVGLRTGVPWMMCKQKDAPDSIISACNGRNCGDTFVGPNGPDKPFLWTENWTSQFRSFGDPPSQRAVEDIAFSVARFFSKNGALANYYMYYGGTNYGRTASAFATTRYYDEAPLDEYGLQREPKWGHLRDLHTTLKLCKKTLLSGTPSVQKLGVDLEARIYEKPGTSDCVAFLANNNTKIPATATFRGSNYYLPRHSISILPNCKIVVFNTQTIVSQHNSREYKKSKEANKNLQWETYQENIPTQSDAPIKSGSPFELMNTTKDTTDYLWYTTSIELDQKDMPFKEDVTPVLIVACLGHALHAFVNGEYVGSEHGSIIQKGGSYMEHRLAGVHDVTIQGLNTGTLDLSVNGWAHKVGLEGEKLEVFTQGGSKRVHWTKVTTPSNEKGPPLTWYKAYFDAPEGSDPVALELRTMAKGMAWVNGKSIGRYWASFLSPLGRPSQSVYHIPRAFLNPSDNLLVLLEEKGGNPDGIEILTVNRNTICSYINEGHPPNVKAWKREAGVLHSDYTDAKPTAELACPIYERIVKVEFASFGDPYGACGRYKLGNCTSPISKKVVEQYCLGKASCSVPVEKGIFNKEGDSCPNTTKTLATQVKCGSRKTQST